MSPYPRITELSEEIDEEWVNTHGGQWFLPCDKLRDFVNREEVEQCFQEAQISNAEDLVEFVLEHAKRLFLLLVLMSSKEKQKLSLLGDLMRDQITDASLPIGFVRGEKKRWYGYSLESSPGGPRFLVSKDWDIHDRRLFETFQWRLKVPIFDNSKFRFHFLDDHVLPYLQVAPKPASEGFFGEVSRIEIHPAHMPAMKAVSDLPLCPPSTWTEKKAALVRLFYLALFPAGQLILRNIT
jgi:hypothetical protein